MIRSLHRWPGLVAAALLLVLSLSGAVLSVFPALETVTAPAQTEAGLTVADLTARVVATHPGVEQIKRAPSGRITAYWFDNGTPGAAVVDPTTGLDAGSADASAVERWMKNLHRSLFLDDTGRIVAAIGAGAMLVLALSGTALVVRRTGGWRRIFAPLKGPLSGRLHVEIARLSVAGLLLSSVTALWMTASTFGYLPEGNVTPPVPDTVSGVSGFAVTDIQALRTTPLSALRELTFPYPDDPTDVYTLKTDAGQGYIDQGTGTLLAWTEPGLWDQVSETIYMLHTGQGAATLGLLLGLMALGVPLMAVTGIIVWVAGRRARPRLRGNATAGQADTVLLVGSEGGNVWGFAATLQAALTAAGQKVHAAPMSAFAPDRYTQVARIIVLASTYGDGVAPASAKGFLDRLAALPAPPAMPLAILGFGDRSFPDFCGYARQVERAAEAKGWTTFLPMDTVNRQSPQDFARWGRLLGAALNMPLELDHQPVAPKTSALTLVSRRDHGAEVQAPTAILRFALPHVPVWRRLTGLGVSRFMAGDLLGIVPAGSPVPRFYSLASGVKDGFVEICVRKHPGGLCSGQLLSLEPGEVIQAFIRPNPGFRPVRGKKPVILIGAGTGIGPLAGFARANTRHRPMHLWFGARHPDSDLLYRPELIDWHTEGRLTSVAAAFSRTEARTYVQDILRRDRARVARLIANGAQVLVCGGRDMAAGVAEAMTDILAPQGLTPAKLKSEGRYAEDVY
ncbi:PepSY domain-containing protein [Hoeflea alexandrii]|uniref:PepSY domain-containing protein n=1 Tax=Hoeflea alexandrii TaxID=288436 RepID=UPI0022AF5503|nr:PepSY domain-containing protein [Hoeflea alexandrii]MCZ4288629.1 PepSY domain-containing protein [Hoeflea alexandrii]